VALIVITAAQVVAIYERPESTQVYTASVGGLLDPRGAIVVLERCKRSAEQLHVRTRLVDVFRALPHGYLHAARVDSALHQAGHVFLAVRIETPVTRTAVS